MKPNSPTGVDIACVHSTVVACCFLSLFSSASQNLQLMLFQTNVLMKLKAWELNSLGRITVAKMGKAPESAFSLATNKTSS